MARNDAYLKQMLLDCITVKDGKSSWSQAVRIRRWLSGQFTSFPTEDTESLALVDNCHLSYCCFEFPHLPNAAMAGTHTFLINFIFHIFSLAICFPLIFLSILSPRSHLLISPFFLFSHFCFFLLVFSSFILFSFSFPSRYFVLSSFLVFHLPSFFFLPLYSLPLLPFYSVC